MSVRLWDNCCGATSLHQLLTHPVSCVDLFGLLLSFAVLALPAAHVCCLPPFAPQGERVQRCSLNLIKELSTMCPVRRCAQLLCERLPVPWRPPSPSHLVSLGPAVRVRRKLDELKV